MLSKQLTLAKPHCTAFWQPCPRGGSPKRTKIRHSHNTHHQSVHQKAVPIFVSKIRSGPTDHPHRASRITETAAAKRSHPIKGAKRCHPIKRCHPPFEWCHPPPAKRCHPPIVQLIGATHPAPQIGGGRLGLDADSIASCLMGGWHPYPNWWHPSTNWVGGTYRRWHLSPNCRRIGATHSGVAPANDQTSRAGYRATGDRTEISRVQTRV